LTEDVTLVMSKRSVFLFRDRKGRTRLSNTCNTIDLMTLNEGSDGGRKMSQASDTAPRLERTKEKSMKTSTEAKQRTYHIDSECIPIANKGIGWLCT